MARVHAVSPILVKVNGLPSSMWFAFRAGIQHERRRYLMDIAREFPKGAFNRRINTRYARRCNWEMLRLMREAKAARAKGD